MGRKVGTGGWDHTQGWWAGLAGGQSSSSLPLGTAESRGRGLCSATALARAGVCIGLEEQEEQDTRPAWESRAGGWLRAH